MQKHAPLAHEPAPLHGSVEPAAVGHFLSHFVPLYIDVHVVHDAPDQKPAKAVVSHLHVPLVLCMHEPWLLQGLDTPPKHAYSQPLPA